jgi:hypothetical protein
MLLARMRAGGLLSLLDEPRWRAAAEGDTIRLPAPHIRGMLTAIPANQAPMPRGVGVKAICGVYQRGGAMVYRPAPT